MLLRNDIVEALAAATSSSMGTGDDMKVIVGGDRVVLVQKLSTRQYALVYEPKEGNIARDVVTVTVGLSASRTTEINDQPVRPKGLLVDFCMPPEMADHRVHALLVAFDERWIPKYGPRLARAIFAIQSLGSVLSFWTDWLMQRLKLLVVLGRS